MVELISFIVIALVIAVVPVFVGCRLLRVDNPAWFMIVIAVVAALALKDMAFRYMPETHAQAAWPAAALLGAFVFSLLLDTAYWRGLIIAALILAVEHIAVIELLDGTPLTDALNERIAAAQVELWPEYND